MANGRDPIDRLVDVLVAVPICAYVAARRAVPLAGRTIIRRLAPGSEIVAAPNDRGDPAVAPSIEVIDDPVAAVADDADHAAVGALPIDDYDHLAARQVVDRLDSLRPDDLHAVAAYERSHRHRQTVLRKIDQLTS